MKLAELPTAWSHFWPIHSTQNSSSCACSLATGHYLVSFPDPRCFCSIARDEKLGGPGNEASHYSDN